MVITKDKKFFIIITILVLTFIWGNSLMPAEISMAFSSWIKGIIESIFNFFGFFPENQYPIEGDGVVRKIAHATEFGVLCIFLMQIFKDVKGKINNVILTGLLVALVDETIQLFIDGRSGQIKDVWIDMLGFTIGLLITLTVKNLRNKKKR